MSAVQQVLYCQSTFVGWDLFVNVAAAELSGLLLCHGAWIQQAVCFAVCSCW